MDALLQDLRYAVRTLIRAPGFTVAAVLTLALGIGANTAIFSVVDGVLLRPAAFSEVDRLAVVWQTDRNSGTTREPASVPDFTDFQQRSRQFSRIAALVGTEMNLTSSDADPRRLAVLAVSADFFSTVGITPIAGRVFSPDEDRTGGPLAVIISEDLWEQAYARDHAVIGRTIRLNDLDRPIVGVLPRGADFGTLQILGSAVYGRSFAERGGRVRLDVWIPLRPDPASSPRDTHPIILLGRLAPAAAIATAQQEMAIIGAELEAAYPQSNTGRGVNVEPLSSVVFGQVRPALAVLLGAVALVLLVACANVANLMLVRGAGRVREVTVRAALGAGARRLARQFLVEGAVLTAVGALLGVCLAVIGLEALLRLAPGDIPRVDAVRLDARVLALTLGVSVIVGVSFGLLPTLQAFRSSLQPMLQGSRGASGGVSQGRFRSALVVTELALAVMLMAGAGLMIRSLWRLQQVDPGFRAENVLKAEYQLPPSRYPRTGATWPRWVETARFNADLRRKVGALPGVAAVTVASVQPLAPGFTSGVLVVGREAEAEAAGWPEPAVRPVSAGYFDVMGVRVTEGREFTESDDAAAPTVAVVNQSAVARFFRGQSPLGQRLRMWGAQRLIVGVVANEHFRGLDSESAPAVYYPLEQAPTFSGSYSLLVRTRSDPETLVSSIRAVVRGMDPALPLFAVEPLKQTIADSMGQRRFTMVVLGVFAALALTLAIVGVHGVLSYAVAQRQREIGIRMALGADVPAVRGMVMSQGTKLAGLGLGIGLVGAFALTRLLTGMLYSVTAADPTTYVAVAVLLGAAALVATYLPARRATLVDATTALRSE